MLWQLYFLIVFPPASVFALAAGFGVFLGSAGALAFGPPIFAKERKAIPMGPRPDSEGASFQASSISSSSSFGSSSIAHSGRAEGIRCMASKPRSSTPDPSVSSVVPPIEAEPSLEDLKVILDEAGYNFDAIPEINRNVLLSYWKHNGKEKMLRKLEREPSFLNDYLKSSTSSSSSSSSMLAPSASVNRSSVQPPRPSLEELQKILKHYRVEGMPPLMQKFLLDYLASYGSDKLLDFVDEYTIFDPYLTKEGEKSPARKRKKSKKNPFPSSAPSPSSACQPESSLQVDPVPPSLERRLKKATDEVYLFPLTPPNENYDLPEYAKEKTRSSPTSKSFFPLNSKLPSL